MALFEIRNLTFTYPGQKKPALTDLSFSLEQGEFLVVCGKSGCGKSTLLRHFKTAMSPYGERKGQILLEGRELDTVSVREQGARIGYVLQSPDNQLVTDKVWKLNWMMNWGTAGTIIATKIPKTAAMATAVRHFAPVSAM